MKKKLFFCILILITLNSNGQTLTNCAICDKQLVTEKQLEGKSPEELSLLRNEIYARKGYIFSEGKYDNYFQRKSWYKPIKSNNELTLTDIESKNINLIKSLEDKSRKKREAAISDLKKLKNALNNNDKNSIESFLGKMKEEESTYYEGLLESLKETFNHINLDNIHWNKSKGLYKVSIDNGYQVYGYEILFAGNQIRIRTGEYSGSEIFGDFNDGYSDYQSEDEYAYWWIFEMQEKGIVYLSFGVAG